MIMWQISDCALGVGRYVHSPLLNKAINKYEQIRLETSQPIIISGYSYTFHHLLCSLSLCLPGAGAMPGQRWARELIWTLCCLQGPGVSTRVIQLMSLCLCVCVFVCLCLFGHAVEALPFKCCHSAVVTSYREGRTSELEEHAVVKHALWFVLGAKVPTRREWAWNLQV